MSISPATDRDILAVRVFDAPRELVWKVWTDPAHIARWWGPHGFTNTIHEMDVRPGGHWRFVMHGPDGRDCQNHSVFEEVVPPERLVFRHESGPHFVVTATFEDLGDRTRLTFLMRFPTAEERDRTVEQFGAVEGLEQNLDRLAAHLAHENGVAK